MKEIMLYGRLSLYLPLNSILNIIYYILKKTSTSK